MVPVVTATVTALVTLKVSIKSIELLAHVEQGALNLNFNFGDIQNSCKTNTMHFHVMTKSSQAIEHGETLDSAV